MADNKVNIEITTTADISGAKAAQAALDAVKNQGLATAAPDFDAELAKIEGAEKAVANATLADAAAKLAAKEAAKHLREETHQLVHAKHALVAVLRGLGLEMHGLHGLMRIVSGSWVFLAAGAAAAGGLMMHAWKKAHEAAQQTEAEKAFLNQINAIGSAMLADAKASDDFAARLKKLRSEVDPVAAAFKLLNTEIEKKAQFETEMADAQHALENATIKQMEFTKRITPVQAIALRLRATERADKRKEDAKEMLEDDKILDAKSERQGNEAKLADQIRKEQEKSKELKVSEEKIPGMAMQERKQFVESLEKDIFPGLFKELEQARMGAGIGVIGAEDKVTDLTEKLAEAYAIYLKEKMKVEETPKQREELKESLKETRTMIETLTKQLGVSSLAIPEMEHERTVRRSERGRLGRTRTITAAMEAGTATAEETAREQGIADEKAKRAVEVFMSHKPPEPIITAPKVNIEPINQALIDMVDGIVGAINTQTNRLKSTLNQ